MKRRRVLRATTACACALLFAASCGRPSPVRTLDGEPDLARIAHDAIPPGFSTEANAELRRLRSVCTAIFAVTGPAPAAVRAELPSLQLSDGQCELSAGRDGPPRLIVGLLASTGGGATLDQTTAVLDGEQPIRGVGERASLDPQTWTLYVLHHGQLWYVQGIQPLQRTNALTLLEQVGRAIVAAAPAQ